MYVLLNFFYFIGFFLHFQNSIILMVQNYFKCFLILHYTCILCSWSYKTCTVFFYYLDFSQMYLSLKGDNFENMHYSFVWICLINENHFILLFCMIVVTRQCPTPINLCFTCADLEIFSGGGGGIILFVRRSGASKA